MSQGSAYSFEKLQSRFKEDIMAQISIIIPAWNLWETTLQCLESIKSTSDSELLQSMEVIVVNNGSTDETANALTPTLKRLFNNKGIEIKLPENLGFAKACNIGAKHATAPFLFFLNNDTLCTNDCLPPLLEAFTENPKLGMVGPILLYPNDTVQHAGVCFAPNLELVHMYHYVPAPYVKKQKQRHWQAITGAAMLIPATLFAECGGFHEGYMNGFEDLDLCCQVRAKGYFLSVTHKSTVYHLASQTPGRFAHDNENTMLFSKRFSNFFYPDQHKIALEADLLPILSPSLHLYIGLPTIKEQVLHKIFSKNFDPARCLQCLDDEPYWFLGYDLLGQYFERQQLWEEALEAYLSLTQLAPLAPNYLKILRCASKLGKSEIVGQATLGFEEITRITHDKTRLYQYANALKSVATQHNDSDLTPTIDQWINTYKIEG